MSTSRCGHECGKQHRIAQIQKKRLVSFSTSSLILFLFVTTFVAFDSSIHSTHEDNISSLLVGQKSIGDDKNYGLTYQLYDNAVLFGETPIYEGTTLSAKLSLEQPSAFGLSVLHFGKDNVEFSSTQILSGSLKGSLEMVAQEESFVQQSENDWYIFDCVFEGTSTGWVRVGSHLVCHDGNAYSYQQEVMVRLLPNRRYPLHATITANSTIDNSDERAPNLSIYWKKAIKRNENKMQHDVKTTEKIISHPLDRGFRKLSFVDKEKDSIILHPDLPSSEIKRQDLNNRLAKGWGHWLLPDILSLTKLPEGIVVGLQICAEQGSDDCVGPVVPDSNGVVKVDKHAADRSYASFNLTFVASDRGSVSLTIETSATGSDNEELRCLITINNCDSCEGFHLQIEPRYAWFRPGRIIKSNNVSLSFSTPGLDDIGVRVLQDINGTNGLLSHNVRQETYLRIPVPGEGQKIGLIAEPLTSHTDTQESLSNLEQNIRMAKKRDDIAMKQAFGPKYEVAQAIRAAVMWSCVYNPIEEGLFMPVSRSSQWAGTFANKAGAANQDWTYVIFEWDNLFASLIAGLFDKDIAYSNLFVSLRSKTPDGFLPNWSTAGGIRSSADRTEPPVGAKIVLELFQKFKDSWVVEALWEDLLEWNDWFVRERLLQPFGLIGLGSYQDHGDFIGDIENNLQAARYESGLDNSPMYDGEEDLLYDEKTHTMQMYDVGMSALVANEAYCLSQLFEVVDTDGKDLRKAELLRTRGDGLRDNIFKHLWDESRNTFANRYRQFLPGTNSSFVRAITPTSFYPLLLPIDATLFEHTELVANLDIEFAIGSMIDSWLLNATRFCLSPEGDFEGNDPNQCYWGLPSVSADDPTYMASGQWNYWRGRVWGPMTQIVFWSLQEIPYGSHRFSLQQNLRYLPESSSRKAGQSTYAKESLATAMSKARKALCAQMEALMMSQWKKNRHICENYSPFKNATECTGTLFYHWGALNGMVGMIEEGYF